MPSMVFTTYADGIGSMAWALAWADAKAGSQERVRAAASAVTWRPRMSIVVRFTGLLRWDGWMDVRRAAPRQGNAADPTLSTELLIRAESPARAAGQGVGGGEGAKSRSR